MEDQDFVQIQQLVRAWLESDQATIDRIIAADWTTIGITGQLFTRAEVMAEFFRDGKSVIAAMTIDDVRVRHLGQVAVVTGRTVARATGSETDVVLRGAARGVRILALLLQDSSGRSSLRRDELRLWPHASNADDRADDSCHAERRREIDSRGIIEEPMVAPR